MVAGSRGHGPGGRAAGRTGSHRENHQPATDPSHPGGADTAARRRAALAAGYRGDAERAAGYLGDPDPEVRTTALGALTRASGLARVVLDTARDDPVASVRRRACEEIGRALGAPDDRRTDDLLGSALDVLREALADTDPSVVEAAAWATGEAGHAAAGTVSLLCDVARDHGAALCREAAVAALGAIGDERGLPAVLGALEDKPAVRRRAAVALAAFADPRAEAGLRRCLDDRDWQVRQVAEDLLRQD